MKAFLLEITRCLRAKGSRCLRIFKNDVVMRHIAAFRSEKQIVHLYQPNGTVSRIPIGHSLEHLMGHQPRRLVVSDLQHTLHLGYQHLRFIHRHMINQPLPRDQWRPGLMEYGACGQAEPCSTSFAIQDLSRANEPCFVMAASGGLESLRPFHSSQMPREGFFSRKLFLKLKQAQFSVPFCYCYTLTWRYIISMN
jgi:hypothetical protein